MPSIRVGSLTLKERRLLTLEELSSALDTMDLDEGVRILGRVKEFRGGGLIFLGRLGDGYVVNTCHRVYDSRLRRYIPKGPETHVIFNTAPEAIAYLRPRIKVPLKAWVY